MNAERKHVPGFEIFFDLQLSGDDVAEEQTDPSVEVEQRRQWIPRALKLKWG